MVFLKPILFRTQNPSQFLKSLNLINPFLKSDLVSSIFSPRLNLFPISLRPFSSSAKKKGKISSKLKNIENKDFGTRKKLPLDVFFKEAVGLVEKSEYLDEYVGGEDGELKRRLRNLEVGVRLKMKEKSENGEVEDSVKSKQRILFELFEENPGVHKENGEMKEKIGNGKGDSVKESKQGGLSGLFVRKENKDGENLRKVDQRMEDHVVHMENGEMKEKKGNGKESQGRGLFELFGRKENNDGENLRVVDHRVEDPGLHNENGEMKEKIGSGNEEDLVKESKQRGLFELFARKENKDGENLMAVDLRMEDSGVGKELSPDMIMFVTHLYKEGYFKDSNFVPRDKFVVGCFENSYARDFVTFAAEQFGRDNQEIATQLSARDMKKVALFGCPSLARKNIFSAKRMRTFFKIQENTVCDRCVLKNSCGAVNQTVWNGDTKALNLGDVMRIITLYALESVPSELVVPEEIKLSVGKLLMEAINLSVKKIS